MNPQAEIIQGDTLYQFCRESAASATPCCRAALLVVERFGGEIWGYLSAQNPHAIVGRSTGGHDFAIIADRWLVDAWAWNHEYKFPKPIFDLRDKSDRALVRALYGPRGRWEWVNAAALRRALAQEDMAHEFLMRRLRANWARA